MLKKKQLVNKVAQKLVDKGESVADRRQSGPFLFGEPSLPARLLNEKKEAKK